MASTTRTLDVSTLREVLARELFDWGSAGQEGFTLTLEALACERDPTPAGPVALGAVPNARPAPPTPARLIECLAQTCGELGVPFLPEGRWGGSGTRVDLGPGGQVRVHSAREGTPARAFEGAAFLQDRLRAQLAREGLELIGIGYDPWNDVTRRPSVDATPWGQCEEQVYQGGGGHASGALRLVSGTTMRIAFGGPLKGPRRWRAAWLLAPVLRAIFANSPLCEGGSGRVSSVRGQAWRFAEPSRCGVQLEGPAALSVGPEEAYLEFALDARVLWILRDGYVYPQTRPLSFANWLTSGVDGVFPDHDDWRAHLVTLRPDVRPERELVFEGCDSQLRGFAGVPLLLASVLLADEAALEGTLSLLEQRAEHAAARCESAWRDGLTVVELHEDARALFAIAADALLRMPRGWVSNTLLGSFVAFEQRYVRPGRTPSDDLLERFLEMGGLGLDAIARLETRGCQETGRIATMQAAIPPA